MNTRALESEKIDNLQLEGKLLHGALRSLARINRWFGNRRSLLGSVKHFYGVKNKELSIVDLGCGGGDIILALATRLSKNNLPFCITSIDGNPNSLVYAKKQCANFSQVRFVQADILGPEFRVPACDILLSSHFMYHFTEKELILFLQHNMAFVKHAFIISELERSTLAISLFRWTRFFLPLSKLARQDGLLALKRSFTKKEWLAILAGSGITSFSLERVYLFRIRLIIKKESIV